MNRTRKVALLLTLLAVAAFGGLVAIDPVWARPTCSQCEINYSNCISGCSTPQCLSNCEQWYDICWGSCYGGGYDTYGECIAQCPMGRTCELNGNQWVCN